MAGKGVSLEPKDKVIGGGGLGPGRAKAKTHRWGMFDYNGKRKPVPALLATFVRDGERYIESYTVGKDWKPSPDGLDLIPKAGQTGLHESCKAMLYLDALKEECGMPDGFVGSSIQKLDGLVGTLTRKPLEKVEGSDKAGSILIFTELENAPWGNGTKGKAKKRAAAVDADDDEDDDDKSDDDEEEASSEKDEDEDEAPKNRSAKKATRAADDDDDDEKADVDEDSEDETEEGVEALIAALEEAPLKRKDVEGAVLAVLKKHPERKAIAKRVATDGFLRQEKGWSFDSKKRLIALDD